MKYSVVFTDVDAFSWTEPGEHPSLKSARFTAALIMSRRRTSTMGNHPEWADIVTAGGRAVGSLTTTEPPSTADGWTSYSYSTDAAYDSVWWLNAGDPL